MAKQKEKTPVYSRDTTVSIQSGNKTPITVRKKELDATLRGTTANATKSAMASAPKEKALNSTKDTVRTNIKMSGKNDATDNAYKLAASLKKKK